MGVVVLDAGVIIGVLDADDVHHASARRAIADRLNDGDELVLPASAYAEVMLGAFASGIDAAAIVDEFVDALPARIEPATREVAKVAAGLRAEHGSRVRLPDALVVATAIVIRASQVITTDTGWPRLPVPAVVLTRPRA